MLKKLLKLAVLGGFLAISANAVQAEESSRPSGMNISIGGDKTFAIRKNENVTFNFAKVGNAVTAPSKLTKDHLDNAWAVNAGVGYMMENGLEGGVTVDYRQDKRNNKAGDIVKLETKTWAALANATYFLDLGNNISPYAGVGAGIARVNLKGEFDNAAKDFSDIKKNKFAYQAKAGVAVSVSNMMLNVGYKYFGTTDLKGDETGDSKTLTSFSPNLKMGEHTVEAGVKFFL